MPEAMSRLYEDIDCKFWSINSPVASTLISECTLYVIWDRLCKIGLICACLAIGQ